MILGNYKNGRSMSHSIPIEIYRRSWYSIVAETQAYKSNYVTEKTSKPLFEKLYKRGLKLITGIKRNMQNHLMPMIEKVLLRKRFIIETIFGTLKTQMNLSHTRHRSPINSFVNILSCLTAYQFKSNKPSFKVFSSLIQN